MSSEPYKILSAVYLILEQDEKILLLQRQNTGFKDGHYTFVAGHIDEDESAKHAMVREAKEEANITLDPNELEVKHVLHRNAKDREYIDFFIQAKKWDGEIKNCEPEKCSELNWYPKSQLPQPFVPHVLQALEQIEQENFYSEFGW